MGTVSFGESSTPKPPEKGIGKQWTFSKNIKKKELNEHEKSVIFEVLEKTQQGGNGKKLDVHIKEIKEGKIIFQIGKDKITVLHNKKGLESIKKEHDFSKGGVDTLQDTAAIKWVVERTEKRFTSSVNDAFRSILAFFYTPYLSKVKVHQSFNERTEMQYKELCRAFRNTNIWMEKGNKNAEQPKVEKQLESALENAEKIHAILQKDTKGRTKSFTALSEELTQKIGNLETGKEILIPIGHMEQGVLQPILLKFIGKENGEIELEILHDTIESASSGTIRYKIDAQKKEKIQQVLQEGFSLLIRKKSSKEIGSGIQKQVESFDVLKKEIMKEDEDLLHFLERPEETEPVQGKNVLFQGFLKKIPFEKEGSEKKSMERIAPNAPNKVLSWLGEDLHEKQKAELLVNLTQDWMEAALRHADFLPEKDKAILLDDCIKQADYVLSEAVSTIFEKTSQSEQENMLVHLQGLKEQVLKKQKVLFEKEAQKKEAALSDFFSMRPNTALQVPFTAVKTVPIEVQTENRAVATGIEPLQVAEELALPVGQMKACTETIEKCTDLFTNEAQRKELSRIYAMEKLQALGINADFSNKTPGEVEQLIEECIETIIRKDVFAVIREVNKKELLSITREEFIEQIKNYILTPHLVHEKGSFENSEYFSLFISLAHHSTISAQTEEYRGAHEALQTVILLRNAVPQKVLKKIEKEKLEDLCQIDTEKALESIQGLLGDFEKSPWLSSQQRAMITQWKNDPSSISMEDVTAMNSALSQELTQENRRLEEFKNITNDMQRMLHSSSIEHQAIRNVINGIEQLARQLELNEDQKKAIQNLNSRDARVTEKEVRDVQQLFDQSLLSKNMQTLLDRVVEKDQLLQKKMLEGLLTLKNSRELTQEEKDKIPGPDGITAGQIGKIQSDVLIKSADLETLQKVLIQIENIEKYQTAVEGMVREKIEAFSPITEKAVGGITTSQEYKKKCLESIERSCTALQELQKSANSVDDVEKKKILLEQVQREGLDLLHALPQAQDLLFQDQIPLYQMLSKEERQALQNNIASIEKAIWQTRMQLGKATLLPQEELLLRKAQSIHVMLLRKDIEEKKQMLFTAIKQDPKKIGGIKHVTVEKDGTININWRTLAQTDLDAIVQAYGLKDCSILAFDKHTLDCDALNVFLTQDVTGAISGDREYHEDLLGLYDFATHDSRINYGVVKGGLINTFERVDESIKSTREPFFIRQDDGSLVPHERLIDGISKDSEAYPSMKMLLQSELYLQMQQDANNRVLDQTDEKNPFLIAHPDTFIQAKTIVVTIPDGILELTTGKSKNTHCHIAVDGHQVAAVVIGKKEEKVLPGVSYFEPNRPSSDEKVFFLSEQRVVCTPEAWTKYMFEESKTRQIEIPADVLASLQSIRLIVSVGRENEKGTYYEQETAFGALSFMSNESHLEFLEYPSVQAYLEESLFGPFILEQAIIGSSERLEECIELLQKAIDSAEKKELIGSEFFLRSVRDKLQTHIQEALYDLQEYGNMAPSLYYLPDNINGSAGALGRELLAKDNDYFGIRGTKGSERAFNEKEITILGLEQPILRRIQDLQHCLRKFEKSDRNAVIGRLETRLQSTQDRGEKITLSRKLLFFYAQGKYTEKERRIGFQAYLNLVYADQDTVHAEDKTLIDGFRKQLLEITEEDIRSITKTEGKWVQDSSNPYLWKKEGSQRSIDLFSCTQANEKGIAQNTGAQKKGLPKNVRERFEVKQAIGSEPLLVTTMASPGQTTYTYTSENQVIKVIETKKGCTILRTIDGVQYRFFPIEHKGETHAERLLSENGIWRREDGNDPEFSLFTNKRAKPLEQETYTVFYNSGSQSIEKITQKEFVLAATKELLQSSPFAAIDTKMLVPFVDPKSGKLKQVQIQGTNISLREKNGEWACYVGDNKEGIIDKKELARGVFSSLPENARDYVLPIQGETKKYLVFPYSVERFGTTVAINKKNRVASVLLKEDEYGIQGSFSGIAYIGFQYILQGDASKYPGERNLSYQRALQYIEALETTPYVRTKEELHDALRLLETLQGYVEEHKEDLTLDNSALLLKLELHVRKLQEKAFEDFGVASFGSKEKEFGQLLAIADLNAIHDDLLIGATSLTPDEVVRVQLNVWGLESHIEKHLSSILKQG